MTILVHLQSQIKWCPFSVLQAYLEFFTSKETVAILLKVLKDYPQVNYHVVDAVVCL